MKVLLIQDDTTWKIEFEQSLKEWGYEFFYAQDAAAARQIIKDSCPRILLVDEEIEEIERLNLFRKVRNAGTSAYIIFLTSKEEDVGADDYLPKPFDKKTLKSRLDAAVKILSGEKSETASNLSRAALEAAILHNVGNALNSINISAGDVLEKITNMEIINLAKLAGILDEHNDNLSEFFANTAQGKNVIPYLKQVSIHLLQQQTLAAEKLCSLMKNIEDVKHIVQMRQNGKDAAQEESLFLNELIENAVEINSAALRKNNIEIIREYDDIGPVLIDRQRTLQILINLIDNAGFSLSQSQTVPKILKIRVAKSEDKKVKIEITDNGVGINPENLAAIFQQGWTTKENGRGFGLHAGKQAADEMQAKLYAKSDGANLGATFILELALKKAEVRNGK